MCSEQTGNGGLCPLIYSQQGFTYVAPSVLEEMARPSVVKARSPRKPFTPNSGGPFSPRNIHNPFNFTNGADSSSSSGHYEQMDTSNSTPVANSQQQQPQGHHQQDRRLQQQQQQHPTWNWKH